MVIAKALPLISPRAARQGMASVWRLYHFQVVPTQGAIPEEGKVIKKNNNNIRQIFHGAKISGNKCADKSSLKLQSGFPT